MRRAAVLAVAIVILLAAWTGTDRLGSDGSGKPAGRKERTQARGETVPWLRNAPGWRDNRTAGFVSPDALADWRGRTMAEARIAAPGYLPAGSHAAAFEWMYPPGVRRLLSRSVPRAVRYTVTNPVRDAMKTFGDLCTADDDPSPKFAVPMGDGVKTYWAVIVGISDYQDPLVNDLNFCDDDADLIEATLLAQPEWIAARITKLVDAAATKANIAAAIAAVAAACDDDDLVFFSYSGHGSTVADVAPLDEADNLDETICPTDMLAADDTTQIRDDEFSTWMAAIPAGAQTMVFIDSCNSGGIIKGLVNAKVRGITGAGVPQKGDGFAKDLFRPKPRPKGLIGPRDMDDLANNVTLTASDDTELSYELAVYGQGLFTWHFVQGLLAQGPADANRNAQFSAEECYAYVRPAVLTDPAILPIIQTPQMFDGWGGELEFLSRPGPEMDVQGNGLTINDGDSSPRSDDDTSFGVTADGVAVLRTFTIRSLGTDPLNLTGAPRVVLSGGGAEFTVMVQPATPIASGGNTTFQIRFLPVGGGGSRQATVSIDNDDPDETPYTFAIEGSTKLRWRDDDRGGSGGGGGCSLAAGPASAGGALGWAMPYLVLTALYAAGRFRRRKRRG